MFDTRLWQQAEQIASAAIVWVDDDRDGYGNVDYVAMATAFNILAVQATEEEAVATCREDVKKVVYRQLVAEQCEGGHPLGWEGD